MQKPLRCPAKMWGRVSPNGEGFCDNLSKGRVLFGSLDTMHFMHQTGLQEHLQLQMRNQSSGFSPA